MDYMDWGYILKFYIYRNDCFLIVLMMIYVFLIILNEF